VRIMDVARFLAGVPTPFDIVWMDPPYTVPSEEVERILSVLDSQGWVRESGLVLAERAGRTSAIEFPESFLNMGYKRYGETTIYYAEKGST